MTDCQFRRYFHMSKGIFQLTCDHIEDIVQRDKFKSEACLDEIIHCENQCHQHKLIANECMTGDFICEEVKLEMTLRILGGS